MDKVGEVYRGLRLRQEKFTLVAAASEHAIDRQSRARYGVNAGLHACWQVAWQHGFPADFAGNVAEKLDVPEFQKTVRPNTPFSTTCFQ